MSPADPQSSKSGCLRSAEAWLREKDTCAIHSPMRSLHLTWRRLSWITVMTQAQGWSPCRLPSLRRVYSVKAETPQDPRDSYWLCVPNYKLASDSLHPPFITKTWWWGTDKRVMAVWLAFDGRMMGGLKTGERTWWRSGGRVMWSDGGLLGEWWQNDGQLMTEWWGVEDGKCGDQGVMAEWWGDRGVVVVTGSD